MRMNNNSAGHGGTLPHFIVKIARSVSTKSCTNELSSMCCSPSITTIAAQLCSHEQSVPAVIMAAAVSTKHTADSAYECKWRGLDVSESPISWLADAGGYIYVELCHYHSAADHDDNFQSI
jgi:hypothetical protein